MSYSANVIEIFLSSPSDVSDEREEIMSLAQEWNQVRGKDSGCHFSILTWENTVVPAMGERPQQVVNDQIGNTYDAYLGVLWTRIGTPTGVSSSGTVEEYEGALARVENGDPVRVGVLFKKALIDPSLIDAEQLARVNDFKTQVSDRGGFYREFSDNASLRSILFLFFEQMAKSAPPHQISDANTSGKGNRKKSGKRVDRLPIHMSEDIGLIENSEEFERVSAAYMLKLAVIGDAEKDNTEALQKSTDSLSTLMQFGSPNAADVKPVVHEAAVSMDRLASYINDNIEGIESDMKQMAYLIDNDIRLSFEFTNPTGDMAEKIGQLTNMATVIRDSVSKLDELIISTQSVPRLSTEIARSKKRLLAARTRLRDGMLSLADSLQNSLDYYNTKTED